MGDGLLLAHGVALGWLATIVLGVDLQEIAAFLTVCVALFLLMSVGVLATAGLVMLPLARLLCDWLDRISVHK